MEIGSAEYKNGPRNCAVDCASFFPSDAVVMLRRRRPTRTCAYKKDIIPQLLYNSITTYGHISLVHIVSL